MRKWTVVLSAAWACCVLPVVASSSGGSVLPALPVGERLEYGVYWGLLCGGNMTISCTETNLAGQKAVVIHVRAKSNWMSSPFFHVDDDVRCFVDPETRLPLRVEKRTLEGGYVCEDMLSFDRDSGEASWVSQSAGISTNYPVSCDTLDAVSFMFAMRSFPFEEKEAAVFGLAVDGQVHELVVEAGDRKRLDVPGMGKRPATCFRATPRTEGLFVRKIPEEIWVSDDPPRVAVRISGRVPVGRFRMVLKERSMHSEQGD